MEKEGRDRSIVPSLPLFENQLDKTFPGQLHKVITMAQTYDHQAVEAKWQAHWAESGLFQVKEEIGRASCRERV